MKRSHIDGLSSNRNMVSPALQLNHSSDTVPAPQHNTSDHHKFTLFQSHLTNCLHVLSLLVPRNFNPPHWKFSTTHTIRGTLLPLQEVKPRRVPSWARPTAATCYLSVGGVSPAVLRCSRALVHVSARWTAPLEKQEKLRSTRCSLWLRSAQTRPLLLDLFIGSSSSMWHERVLLSRWVPAREQSAGAPAVSCSSGRQ